MTTTHLYGSALIIGLCAALVETCSASNARAEDLQRAMTVSATVQVSCLVRADPVPGVTCSDPSPHPDVELAPATILLRGTTVRVQLLVLEF